MTIDEFEKLAHTSLINFALNAEEAKRKVELADPYLGAISKLSELADNPETFYDGMVEFVVNKRMAAYSKWN